MRNGERQVSKEREDKETLKPRWKLREAEERQRSERTKRELERNLKR